MNNFAWEFRRDVIVQYLYKAGRRGEGSCGKFGQIMCLTLDNMHWCERKYRDLTLRFAMVFELTRLRVFVLNQDENTAVLTPHPDLKIENEVRNTCCIVGEWSKEKCSRVLLTAWVIPLT